MIELCNEVTYVLLCENDVYYVGKTKQLHRRLTNHFNNNGSVVTKTFKPIKVVKLLAGNREHALVKRGRAKYGKDKCFGGCFHLNSNF